MSDPAEDYINGIMWAGFIRFAFAEPSFREAFTAETGLRFMDPPKSAIEAMVDEATGVTNMRELTIKKFVEWATKKHYGLEYAPQSYRDSLATPESP